MLNMNNDEAKVLNWMIDFPTESEYSDTEESQMIREINNRAIVKSLLSLPINLGLMRPTGEVPDKYKLVVRLIHKYIKLHKQFIKRRRRI